MKSGHTDKCCEPIGILSFNGLDEAEIYKCRTHEIYYLKFLGHCYRDFDLNDAIAWSQDGMNEAFWGGVIKLIKNHPGGLHKICTCGGQVVKKPHVAWCDLRSL